MRNGSLVAVLTAVVAFFLVAQVASAQYPPPKTTLVCAINQIEVKTSTSTAVAATLRDTSGNALEGYGINFRVVSGNASLLSSSATTDSSGTAVVTVRFGNSGGTVVIGASSESSECQASAAVYGIVPPSTGDAGLLSTETSSTATVAGFALAVALMGAGAYAVRRTNA